MNTIFLVYLIGVICSVIMTILTGIAKKDNKITFWTVLAGVSASLLSWGSVAVYVVLIYLEYLSSKWTKLN